MADYSIRVNVSEAWYDAYLENNEKRKLADKKPIDIAKKLSKDLE